MRKPSIGYVPLLLLLLLTCSQCRTSRSKQLQKDYKTTYIHQFKLTYLRKLLQAGFNHSEAIYSLIQFDRSGFSEPILSDDDYRLIDSLVKQDNLRMATDSIDRMGRVAEGAQGKHVLTFMLYRMQGKWLDSLAKRRYNNSDKKSWYSE